MSRYRPAASAEGRARAAAARQQKIGTLQATVSTQLAGLRTGADWTRWLRVVARAPDLSVDNSLLVLATGREITAVADYGGWQALGRQVVKGQKGMPLLTAGVRSERADGRESGIEVGHVFDVSQTTGPDIPARTTPTLDALATVVASQGYRFERRAGLADPSITLSGSRIVRVRSDLTDAQAAQAAARELARIRLHALKGQDGAAGPPTDQVAAREMVIAESVAYLAAAPDVLGLRGYAFPTVASWAGGPPDTPLQEVVHGVARRVVEIHQWILTQVVELAADADPNAHRTASRLLDRAVAGAVAAAELRDRAQGKTPAARPAAATDAAADATLLTIHASAADFFAKHLRGSWADSYLTPRVGVIDQDLWRPGYAPDRWTALVDYLRRQGHSDQAIEQTGLGTRARTGRLIDRFRDRLMFPITNLDGHPVAFVGRHHPDLDGSARSPKYVNSPESSRYRKGEHLFGLHQARQGLERGALPVLVEGPLDTIAVTSATGGRAVGLAALGTALTREQVTALHQVVPLGGQPLVLATDADRAGRLAAARAFPLLTARGSDPHVPNLPAGHDPASYIADAGPAAFLTAITTEARPLAHQLIDDLVVDFGASNTEWVEPRVAAAKAGAEIVSSLPPALWERDTIYLSQATGVEVTNVQYLVVMAGTRDTAARPEAVHAATEERTGTPPRLPSAARVARQSSPRSHRPRGAGRQPHDQPPPIRGPAAGRGQHR